MRPSSDHQAWIDELWVAQYAIARQCETGIYPYLIPDAHSGWIPWAGRTGARFNGRPYFANTLGLRADPTCGASLALPTDKPLALVVGDSHVHGDEVGLGETWIARLNRTGTLPFHLVNAGVPGYGMDQALWRFDALCDRIKPRVGILSMATCDFTRHVNMLRLLRTKGTGVPFVKPVFDLVEGRFQKIGIPEATIDNFAETFTTADVQGLLARHDFFSPDAARSRPLRRLFRLRAIQYVPKFVSSSSGPRRLGRALRCALTARPMAATLHIIRLFREYCVAKRIVPAIVFQPMQGDYLRGTISHLIYRWLRSESQTFGMPCFDPHDALERRLAASDVWAARGHLNVEGSLLFANALIGTIQQSLRDLS